MKNEPLQFLGPLKTILRQIDPNIPLESSLENLLETIAAHQGYHRIALAIIHPQTKALKLSLTHDGSKQEKDTYFPGQGISGQVLETGETIVLERIKDSPDFLNFAGRTLEELSNSSFICVPIPEPFKDKDQRSVLGVLSVDLPLSSSETLVNHKIFLEILAAIIARQVAYLQEHMIIAERLKTQGMPLEAAGTKRYTAKNIVASSKSMNMVLEQISQVAASKATVLLRGESGTGKELLAEAIHTSSSRSREPFIKLNCAALPADLLESELFGHEKGAFTGAIQAKKGRFELSHKGTLFLDEIGELSVDAQAKLLRAIQEGEIQRLGSEKTITVDVRLICATHQQLEKLLQDGDFREDLYYRINVFPVFIPPLRERTEDILPLAEHFLAEFAKEYEKNIRRISTPAIDLLTQYHWPGNVREVRNCMERAVLICNEEVIRTYHLPPTLQTAESSATDTDLSFGEAVARFEQEIIVESLKKARGNMLQAARDL
ncbi:MAG: sigma 54-interacting transcriptional regulator, partial [Desulfovibrionales bacterium]